MNSYLLECIKRFSISFKYKINFVRINGGRYLFIQMVLQNFRSCTKKRKRSLLYESTFRSIFVRVVNLGPSKNKNFGKWLDTFLNF